jgi:hypothetical protein
MDNIAAVSEVHGGQRQFGAGSGLVKVKKIDLPSMPEKERGELLNSLWKKLETQDYAFDDFSRGNPQAFVLNITDMASAHFLVDDSGYVVVRNLFAGSDANIHFVCWDRHYPHKNVIEAGRQIMEWLYKSEHVNRVSAYVPKYNLLAARFTTSMGFKYEGTLRKAVKFHDEYHDVDIYGLLEREFDRRFTQ